jgi:DNA-binding NarL/FixJ family response regulator
MQVNKTTKVIIAEDQPLYADILKQVVDSATHFEVIATVNNGRVLLQALNRLTPDLILMDIEMPPFLDGLETAKLIRNRFGSIKIIFISGFYFTRYKEFIQENNINGFVYKHIGAPELKEVLEKVMKGEKVFIPPPKMEQPVSKLPEPEFMKIYKLTKTETEIIKLISEGESSKMIASTRGIELYTVETHRKNIFRKLGAKNMADVVAFAVVHGIYKSN